MQMTVVRWAHRSRAVPAGSLIAPAACSDRLVPWLRRALIPDAKVVSRSRVLAPSMAASTTAIHTAPWNMPQLTLASAPKLRPHTLTSRPCHPLHAPQHTPHPRVSAALSPPLTSDALVRLQQRQPSWPLLARFLLMVWPKVWGSRLRGDRFEHVCKHLVPVVLFPSLGRVLEDIDAYLELLELLILLLEAL